MSTPKPTKERWNLCPQDADIRNKTQPSTLTACPVASTRGAEVPLNDNTYVIGEEEPPPPYNAIQSTSPALGDRKMSLTGAPSDVPTQTPLTWSGQADPQLIRNEYRQRSISPYEKFCGDGADLEQVSCPPTLPGWRCTEARSTSNGRIQLSIQDSPLISTILRQAGLSVSSEDQPRVTEQPHLAQDDLVQLNIVMHVVGSRGDVQPFLSVAKTLQSHGHRVRLATHPCFQDFVESNGVEFFSIGGDPAKLMAFMVQNPGLIPGVRSVARGEVNERQKEMHKMLIGCWRSCIEPGNGLGPSISEGHDRAGNVEGKPFLADAIIANPPSSAHIHCAEKLGIPLHILFTMPWSPTVKFPHPLTDIVSTTAGERKTNFISYSLVETLIWQGLGRTINHFREKVLFLDSLGDLSGPAVTHRLRIPHTYCWSPSLIPKPRDWEDDISISGFCFLSQTDDYTPDPALTAFLRAGPPPIYIGFGSIVVDDPDGLTEILLAAIKKTGVRALISKGWGGLGKESVPLPEDVYILGNVPHDWLFQHVSSVVHHGGAGTTAIGMACGKPTVIVPFFGDQPFWGAMIARAGAGPSPIPFKKLTEDTLAEAITTALEPSSVVAAKKLAASIASENGSETAVDAFHQALNVDHLRCDLAPGHIAVWQLKKRNNIKLSSLAAQVLSQESLLSLNDLKLFRPREYVTDMGSIEPISGGLCAIIGAIGNLMLGMVSIPVDVAKAVIEKPSSTIPQGHPMASPDFFIGSREKLLPKSCCRTTKSIERRGLPLEPSRQPQGRAEPVRSSFGQDRPEASTHRKLVSQTKTKVTHKITVGKAFGFGFLKELSGSESVARALAFKNNEANLARTDPERSSMTDAAVGAGKGLGRMAAIGLKTPVEFAMGITSGFNNAPKLYGDTTVRPIQKVTGFSSGVEAATKGLGYGFYDGVTGLVTQPVRGAREEGVTGLLKGLGRGVGGSVLKPGAAIFGIAGYALKGTWQEVQNHFDASLQSYIVSVRRKEGLEAWQRASFEERAAVIEKWRLMK